MHDVPNTTSRANEEEVGKGQMQKGADSHHRPQTVVVSMDVGLPRLDIFSSCSVFFVAFRVPIVWIVTQCDFSDKCMFLSSERGSIIIILSSMRM